MKHFGTFFLATLLCVGTMILTSCDNQVNDPQKDTPADEARRFVDEKLSSALELYNYYKAVPLEHADILDEDHYAEVLHERLNTLNALRMETQQYFTGTFIENHFTELSGERPLYIEKNGKLFVLADGVGANLGRDFDPDSFSLIQTTEADSLRFSIVTNRDETTGVAFTYIFTLRKDGDLYKIDDMKFATISGSADTDDTSDSETTSSSDHSDSADTSADSH